MGVRDRLRKVFGTSVPPQIEAAEAAAGMTPTNPFSPGEPIGPYDGFSRNPRSQDFVTGYNIATRPRTHERVSFGTLKGLIGAYDVAQIAIWHRIDSIRSLDWSLVATPGYSGDVTDAISVGMAALKKPDRTHPFDTWLGAYLFDVLAYDAGALYRMRNRAGRAVGLMNVDGTTLAPLLSYWGTTPEDGAPAYVQYANGLPWNWLTTNDVLYTPFRKVNDSPYGKAPLESILLNANTDLRFQQFFLQHFTEGNIPAAFASAPETWTPQQIEQFQGYWDSFMLGDQAVKSQIKWIPGGSKIDFVGQRTFDEKFPMYLMRKTAAALHVVPSDLGFTETINRSSGESQADVQHRVGDLPLLRKVQNVLSGFLQDDLGLPVSFLFDLGEEQADRYQQAQADKIYVELGAISSSDVRQMRYGLEEPEGQKVPRFIFTERSGPIPLSSLLAVAGQIDPETAAPEPGAPLPHEVFGGTEGVLPNPPIKVLSLAERMFGPSALPPAPPPQPILQAPMPQAPGQLPVAKDGGSPAGVGAGITTATGITSYDLVGHDPDEEDDDPTVVEIDKAVELVAFKRFVKDAKRRKRWRDFQFAAVDPVTAHRLNDAARAGFRKANGEIAVAGLVVHAADTGRVLMIQRGVDPEDPASGLWEFPGGHVEGQESPLAAACREWQEETGCLLPADALTDANPAPTWTSPNGVYQGFVATVACEAGIPVGERGRVTNPDDPDGDMFEALAWWDPSLLPDNPAVRPELLDTVDLVQAAIACAQTTDPDVLVKAGGGRPPKGSASHAEAVERWPAWDYDLDVADYWSARITRATVGALSRERAGQIVRGFAAAHPVPDGRKPGKAERDALAALALAYLLDAGIDIAGALRPVLVGLRTDGYLIGAAAALALTDGAPVDVGGWTPGDTGSARDRIDAIGAGAGLTVVLAGVDDLADALAESRTAALASALAAGVAAGNTDTAVADALRAVLAASWRAQAAAATETTDASSTAATDAYTAAGITYVTWELDPNLHNCPICVTNSQSPPVPLGQPFPSGHTKPGIHVKCGCALVPAKAGKAA